MSFLEKIGFTKKKPVVETSKTNEVEKNDDEQLESSGEVSPELTQELDNLKNEADDLNKVISLNNNAANEKVKNSKELQDKIYDVINIISKIGLASAVVAGPAAMIIDHFTGSKLTESLVGTDIDGIMDKVHTDAFLIKDFALLALSFAINIPGMIREVAIEKKNKAEALKERKEKRAEMMRNQEITNRSTEDLEVKELEADVNKTTAEELEKVRKDLAA